MHPVIAFTSVVLAGGSGASVWPVAETPSSYFVVVGKDGTAANGAVLFSKTMGRSGTMLSLDWRQTTPGINGVGAGNNVFRTSLVVTPKGGEPSTACSLDVACDAPPGAYTTTCAGATYNAGDTVLLTITTQPCLGAPSGFPVFDAEN